MAKATRVLQTPTFRKAVNKLKSNQKKELDGVVKELMTKPGVEEQKKGDLAFLRVYKFKMNKQLTLLGYSIDDGTVTLELLAPTKTLPRYQKRHLELHGSIVKITRAARSILDR